jgi:hypothetical protein
MLAIPTTAGTGSEVTSFSVITDHSRDYKLTVGSTYLLPEAVILDPGLITTVPEKTAAYCGVDAMVHALESYISLAASPFSDMCALKALELLGKNIRKYVDIPVVCAGRMDPEVAAEAVAKGEIDGAGFARRFLADTEWVTKLLNDREEDIRPCILCHSGCFNMCHYKGVPNDQELSDSLHLARCAVNAETMQKEKHFIQKTSSPKEVAIIGGGIGGMEAARVLTLRGHKPVIYEKSDVLGGTFIAASAESYKGKLRELWHGIVERWKSKT